MMIQVRKLRFLPALLSLVSGCMHYQSQPLDGAALQQASAIPSDEILHVRAAGIRHPLLKPVELDFQRGLTPDGAAVLAVLVNPALRVERNRRITNAAQLFQAGLLPNPQLLANAAFVTGGNTVGTVSPWDIGATWDFTSLIGRNARLGAIRSTSASIDLDIAWIEWQTAQAAKTACYDRIALEAQLRESEDVDQRLAANLQVVQAAVNRHERLLLDLAAAEAASQDAHAAMLALRQQVAHQRLVLLRAIGLPADAVVRLREDIQLPSQLALPPTSQFYDGLEERRLDLIALRRGYESQEQTLRAAILAQFPKIQIGFTHARDNTNVVTDGFGLTIDLPIFDRNQGVIATERATRQRLFDEYLNRSFQARSDIAMAIADISALTVQIEAAAGSLPGLQRLVDTYRQAMDRGNVDVLSYYTAQSNLSQKRLTLVKLKQQLAQDRIVLELASGQYLPEEAIPSSTQPSTHPAFSTMPEAKP